LEWADANRVEFAATTAVEVQLWLGMSRAWNGLQRKGAYLTLTIALFKAVRKGMEMSFIARMRRVTY
jgi:hypothetical protein